MGCAASRIEKEERVRVCKERKKLMKQLLVHRKEFADSQLGYLRSLKNSGVTLRQFTESELLEPEDIPFKPVLPPSPPPPLPPSPPPPPAFSPDIRKFKGLQEEIIETENNSSNTPPPPVLSSSWELWDRLSSSSRNSDGKSETVEQDEEENWAETRSEFMEEGDEGEHISCSGRNILPENPQPLELMDDGISMMSWHTRDTTDMAMVVPDSNKTLASTIRELDDYFLKASAGGEGVAVLMDINISEMLLFSFSKCKRKMHSSAKVFNALSWSWSFKSLPPATGSAWHPGPDEMCKPGGHCNTLEKLYSEEQKLYKLVKELESTKVEHEKKSFLLQKQDEEHGETRTEKTQSTVESLQIKILSLQESINGTISAILDLINDELTPQMVALISGLIHMWSTMHECHQVQNYISQQLTHLSDQPNMDPTTAYHRQAAAQLKTEISSWYFNFCKVVKEQREYIHTIFRWSQLCHSLADEIQRDCCPASLHSLSQEWLLALDSLPDKMVSEAIKSLTSGIQSIIEQQEQEVDLHRRSNKLEKKLERESNFLAEMEMKAAMSFNHEDTDPVLNPKHPLFVKRAKVEALKKKVGDEKAKYTNSIKVTQAMILNNLQTSLPNVFRALTRFSDAYAQLLKSVLDHASLTEDEGSNA